jgi:hypothetical protein
MARKKAEPAKEPYSPASLEVGDDYLDERDTEKMQKLVGNPSDTAAMEELSRTTMARAMTQPEVRSASIIQRFDDNLDINHLAKELRYQSAMVRSGDMSRAESMLIAQAHSLDALFGNLTRRAHGNMEAGYLQATETYLRLALRAQNQCRSTLETLSTIKNPPVVFAKQMNVANGPQQVNNGVLAQPEPARTLENEIAQNELGEHRHELLENTRASSITGRAVPEPEALGAIHRAKD